MARSEIYTVYRNVVVAAGGSREIGVVGSYVSVLEATLDFEIGIEDDALQFITQGLTIGTRDGSTFKRVRIENPNGGAITVTLAVGIGEIRDARLSASAPLSLTKAANFASAADVSIAATANAVVLAANAARRLAIIKNLTANLREFRIGDAGAAAGEGHELMPGEKIEIATTAEIRAFNPHGSAQSLSVLEVLD